MSTKLTAPRTPDARDESCPQDSWPLAKAARHLQRATSLMAAARDEFDRYFECVDALSPLMFNVGRVVEAADWLKAAETALCGGSP